MSNHFRHLISSGSFFHSLVVVDERTFSEWLKIPEWRWANKMPFLWVFSLSWVEFAIFFHSIHSMQRKDIWIPMPRLFLVLFSSLVCSVDFDCNMRWVGSCFLLLFALIFSLSINFMLHSMSRFAQDISRIISIPVSYIPSSLLNNVLDRQDIWETETEHSSCFHYQGLCRITFIFKNLIFYK